MAKGGRGYFRPSYGQPKFILFSKKREAYLSRCKKVYLPKSSELSLTTRITSSHSLWEEVICVVRLYFQNCGRYTFLLRLIILLTDRILSHSPNFGRPKQGQTFVVPTFHIHFLNPECVRIPWVLAPKNFPVENFRVRSVLQKSSVFH